MLERQASSHSSTCAAGLPARYRHPLTGMPYATREAFAQIERHAGGAHAAAPVAVKQRYDGIAGPGEH
jgi:YL1 nuclear protein C-terminal domain